MRRRSYDPNTGDFKRRYKQNTNFNFPFKRADAEKILDNTQYIYQGMEVDEQNKPFEVCLLIKQTTTRVCKGNTLALLQIGAVHWLFNGFSLDNTRTIEITNDFHYFRGLLGFSDTEGSLLFDDPFSK